MVLLCAEVFEMKSGNPNRLRDSDLSFENCTGPTARAIVARGCASFQSSVPAPDAACCVASDQMSLAKNHRNSLLMAVVTDPFGRSAPLSLVDAALKRKYPMSTPRFRSKANTQDNSCACLGEPGTYIPHLFSHLKLL